MSNINILADTFSFFAMILQMWLSVIDKDINQRQDPLQLNNKLDCLK